MKKGIESIKNLSKESKDCLESVVKNYLVKFIESDNKIYQAYSNKAISFDEFNYFVSYLTVLQKVTIDTCEKDSDKFKKMGAFDTVYVILGQLKNQTKKDVKEKMDDIFEKINPYMQVH